MVRPPWQLVSEGLPPFDSDDLSFCRETAQVLIRTRQHQRVHLARYREYLEDGQPDPEMSPVWILDGSDGYAINSSEVDAWAPTPHWY